MEYIILVIGAVFTSMVSAITGMAGGVLLLSLMSFYFDYRPLVALHGIVQLFSNGSRSYYLRSHLRYDFFIPFILGAPFGFLIAYYILNSITHTHYLYLILGLFIMYTVFKPKKLPQIKLKGYSWSVLGLAAGIQGSLIGVTGPLLAPFFIRDDLTKEEVVATKAILQIVTHALKIPLFLSLSFNYLDYYELIIFLVLATLMGTFLGVKVLGRIDEKLFTILFKVMLFIAALRMFTKFGMSI